MLWFHLKALLVELLKEVGSVEDHKTEKFDLVCESVAEDPEVSIRRRSQQVGLVAST